MDKIHDPEGRAWISHKINLKNYFEEYQHLVEGYKPVVDMKDLKPKWMKKMVGLDDDKQRKLALNTTNDSTDNEETAEERQHKFEQVEAVMNIGNLDTTGEVEPMQVTDPVGEIYGVEIPKFRQLPIPEEGLTKLKTLFLQDKWLVKSKEKRSYKQKRKRQSKSDNDHWFHAEKPQQGRTNSDYADKQMLFCVRVYRPFKHLQPHSAGNVTIRYSQEIWLLGHHTLAHLKDQIRCTADLYIVGEQQSDTERVRANRAQDVYKSGFIYIEGCFYNDMREAENIDYSEVIRTWASNPSRGVGPFTTARMEETQLKDLDLRLGHPYVYTHQGEHEHLISFIDIRLLGSEDPQRPSDYPLIRSLGSQQSRYCMVCETYIAVWVTTDNNRVPEDPFFWCGGCYKNFNFKDRRKIGSFNAYRYFDINVI